MARIQERFTTNKTVAETRNFIDEKILSRPEIELMLQDHHWAGNVLHASGAMGQGTLTVEDGAVIVDIDLSLFGAAAQSKIQEALSKQLMKLNDR